MFSSLSCPFMWPLLVENTLQLHFISLSRQYWEYFFVVFCKSSTAVNVKIQKGKNSILRPEHSWNIQALVRVNSGLCVCVDELPDYTGVWVTKQWLIHVMAAWFQTVMYLSFLSSINTPVLLFARAGGGEEVNRIGGWWWWRWLPR